MANVQKSPGLVAMLRSAVRAYRHRYDVLTAGTCDAGSLRKLQHEVVRAYVEAQRLFVSIQSGTLAQLRADVTPDASRRARSLELYEDVGTLHDLMTLISGRIATLDRARRN
ncbi:MAG: hypothetical protein H0T46_00445 [Deltaproteobacteria bacterium]|nr:hypothetical protein [Deltaproteobacteria bacterium]